MNPSAVFSGNLAYVNREATLPAEVSAEPLWLSDLLSEDANIRSKTSELLRVVVHPNARDVRNGALAGILRILESPYECGRVLESPDSVMIRGVPYVLTVKGVGATGFFRRTHAIAPWHWRGREKDPALVRAMKRRTYHDDRGVFDFGHAEESMKGYGILREFGVETEIPLATHRLRSLPDSAGRMRSIAELKKRRHLHEAVDPVLYVRATKTNFRILDPIRMNESQEFRPLIAPFFAHALELHRNLNDPGATMQEYVEWLFEKTFRTELRLALAGIYHGGEVWSDFGRNWSIQGEILDLDDTYSIFEKGSEMTARRFCSHVSRRMDLLIVNVRHFLNALLHAGEMPDFERIADVIVRTVHGVCALEAPNHLELFRRTEPSRSRAEPTVATVSGSLFYASMRRVFDSSWCDHESNRLQAVLKSTLRERYGFGEE